VPPPPDCRVDFDILDGVGVSRHIVDDGCGHEDITTWFRPVSEFEDHDRVHAVILEQLPDGQLIGHLCKGKCNSSACSVPKGIELATYYFDNTSATDFTELFKYMVGDRLTSPVDVKKRVENKWEIGGWDEINQNNGELLPQNPRIRCSRTSILENGIEVAYTQTENTAWDGFGHYKVTKIFGTGLTAPKLILRKFDLRATGLPTAATMPAQGNFDNYPYFRNRQAVEVVTELATTAQPSCVFSSYVPTGDDPIGDNGGDNQTDSFPLYRYSPPAGTVVQSPNTSVIWMQYEKNRIKKRVEMNYSLSAASFIDEGIHAGADFTLSYTPAATDNRISYEYDNLGQLVSARLENASSKPESPTSILYGWEHGVPSSKQFEGYAYFEAEREIDPSTGFILSEKDSNQLTTSFSYDEQGRLVKITPPNGETPTWISYPVLNGTAHDITYYRGANSPVFSGSDPIAAIVPTTDEYARYHFDGLGRLVRTIKLAAANDGIPGNEYVFEDIGYDSTGRKIFTSLPYSGTPNTMKVYFPRISPGNSFVESDYILVPTMGGGCPYGTVESIYENASCSSFMPSAQLKDPLGRTRSVISADGSVAKLSYQGFDTTAVVSGIHGTGGAITSVKKSHYDALGRLTSVDEQIGTDAVYRYDAMNRLLQARLIASPGSGLGEQNRYFSYNSKGLLAESYQPESGLTRIIGFDVWGNPLEIEDANARAAGYAIDFVYDAKGRRLSEAKKTASGTTIQNWWQYDQGTAGTCFNNRLSSSQQSYPLASISFIKENFVYDGLNGRLGRKDVSSGGKVFSVGYEYYFPSAYLRSETMVTPDGSSAKIISGYQHGLLTSRVFSSDAKGAKKITYHPSGTIDGILINDDSEIGMRWIKKEEDTATGRLASISYLLGSDPNSTPIWTTGMYSYDGAGNIYKVGDNNYYYDNLSRMVQAEVSHGLYKYMASYTYDDYGNMKQKTIQQVAGSDPQSMSADFNMNATINTSTNRYATLTNGPYSNVDYSTNGYDANGNQLKFLNWQFTYDEMNRLTRAVNSIESPGYYYDADGERMAVINRRNVTSGTSQYYLKDGLKTLCELTYTMTNMQTTGRREKYYLYVGGDILASSEKETSITVATTPIPVDPRINSSFKICPTAYANGTENRRIVSLSDPVVTLSKGEKYRLSYSLENVSSDLAGVVVRLSRIKDQGDSGNSGDNGEGCPRNDEDKVDCYYFIKGGMDAGFVFGRFGLCGNQTYGTVTTINEGAVYPIIFNDLQKDKLYRVSMYCWTSWGADPNLGYNLMKMEEGELIVPKKDPSTFFEMRGTTKDDGGGFRSKLRAKWGNLQGVSGYKVRAKKQSGQSIILGDLPAGIASFEIDSEQAIALGVDSQTTYQLEGILPNPNEPPIIIGPTRGDLVPITCTVKPPHGYDIPVMTDARVFGGQIAYLEWDTGHYPAPYYRVYSKVSHPGKFLGHFVEEGITSDYYYVDTSVIQLNEGDLLGYAVEPLDASLQPLADISFARLVSFVSSFSSLCQPKNMSTGDGTRLIELRWHGGAMQTGPAPWDTPEPYPLNADSGLFYELLRGYNPNESVTGCGAFTLADFGTELSTVDSQYNDTRLNAGDSDPLLAYKLRMNYKGNLPLQESACKWTKAGYCYEKPLPVEWIRAQFTGAFDENGAPIITVEWALAGPPTTTSYDLFLNGGWGCDFIGGDISSLTFGIGGHPDVASVTHTLGVRVVNLVDGCLSEPVFCTVTVPGDQQQCPDTPGVIELRANVTGVPDSGTGVEIQLVWSGDVGTTTDIMRSFTGCDGPWEDLNGVPSMDGSFHDVIDPGQTAYYKVEGSRPGCTDPVGKSGCVSVTASPFSGLLEGTVYFYVKDHLGNTRLVLDTDGNIKTRMDYEPYGMELYPLDANDTNEKYKFTNQERDFNTGLDYFHARYYSSVIGRFTGADSVVISRERLANPQRLNLFSYAANNPVIYYDYTGKDVDVGNRTVSFTVLGAHAFIIVTPTGANVQRYASRIDKNTGTITLSGFPTTVVDSNTGKTKEVLIKTQNDPRDVGNAKQTINVPAPEGTSMEQFETDVIEAFDSYKACVPYDPIPDSTLGEANSNSLASGILDAAGTDTEDKPDTGDLNGYNAGWDLPVKLPDATVNNDAKEEKK